MKLVKMSKSQKTKKKIITHKKSRIRKQKEMEKKKIDQIGPKMMLIKQSEKKIEIKMYNPGKLLKIDKVKTQVITLKLRKEDVGK